MLIDRIELHHVAMPLITPWRTAYGEDSAVHALLCRLSSGSVDAWGESALFAAPTYKPEWGAGVFLLARDWLAPRLLGQEIASGAALQERLSAFKGNPFAKAAFDIAWWHLRSKIEGRSLHALLGATRTEAPVGQDFGVGDDIDALLASVDGAVAEGYRGSSSSSAPAGTCRCCGPCARASPSTRSTSTATAATGCRTWRCSGRSTNSAWR